MTRPAFVPAVGDYVMFAGALEPHKGIDVLLEAHARLAPPVPLVLVGLRRADSPERFGSGVIVVENVPHAEVLRAWRHCAIAVVPSRWPEPFGLVAIEAMASGRPVIASSGRRTSGVGSRRYDGSARARRCSGALDALTQLLADPERRERMGTAARERAADYSASAVVPQIERVYDEVVSSPLLSVRARGRSWPR